MATFFAWVFLLSSPSVVELSITSSVHPAEALSWDRLGLFNLKDGKERRMVLLYYYDSDSVARKIMARGRVASAFYPNIFQMHAFYQVFPGKWVHQEVFGYARVHFIKVEEVAPDHLVIQCRPNFRIEIPPGGDISENIKKALKMNEEINRPFTQSISFENGKLIAK